MKATGKIEWDFPVKKSRKTPIHRKRTDASKTRATLADLVAEYQLLERELVAASGELTPEIEERLSINQAALATKADAYVFVEERLEMNAEFFKRKAEAFDAIAKRFKNARERLKSNLKSAMQAMGTAEVVGSDYRWVLKRSNPTLVIEDEKALPDECLLTTVETKPNKEMIKGLLKEGKTIPGARLEESFALQPYEVTHE
jgi:hypothetical protein